MKRVLVTGATGFIGNHLVHRLHADGCEVRCLVRSIARGERLQQLGTKLVPGDITDPDSLRAAVADVDVVFHLAGLTKALHARQFWQANEEGTSNIAAASAAVTRPPVLVYVSSLAAAGPCIDGRPRTERDGAAPVSHYGRSKRGGELAAAVYARQLPVTVVRPPIVLGPGDRDGLDLFRTIAIWNLHMVPGRSDALYSVIHAADLAAALVAAANRGRRLNPDDEQAGTYFVAADELVTYSELGTMVARSLGKSKFRIVRSPNAGVWTIATVNQLFSQLRRKPHFLAWDKARDATAGGWACSDRALRQDTGFAPARTLQQRLDETVAWYRAEGWLPPKR